MMHKSAVIGGALLILLFNFGFAFMAVKLPGATSFSKLRMAGGRSPAERNMSKKQMFRFVRDKVNEHAKIPGFFDVGEGPPDIDLYCRSNRDGTQISDCPDAQFLQMVMLKKNIRYTVVPTLPSKRPDWLLENHDGVMPAMSYRDEIFLSGPLVIAEYLDKKYPLIPLTKQGAYNYTEVLDWTKDFFPSLTACIKNKDPETEPALREEVHRQLDIIDNILRTSPGRYLCGIEQTLADFYLTPRLFHAAITMDKFKKDQILAFGYDPKRPSLETYMKRMFATPEFNHKKAYYNQDQVVYSWKVARRELVVEYETF